jgi:hypothetical protein
LDESLEENMAFNDIVDLTGRFKIKNKKTEIDGLIAKLKSFIASEYHDHVG